ncbi:MAG: phage major tail tube protein [Candidatus Gastranaerophilaceae bacterium]
MATVLSNAHLFIGTSMFGKVNEFKFPDVENVTASMKTIDSIGEYVLPIALKLDDSSIKFAGFSTEAFEKFADMQEEHIVTVRGNLKEFQGVVLQNERPIKGLIKCLTKKISALGTIKGQENAEFSVDLIPHAVKLEYNGNVLLEIDLPNNIYTVNGEDKLARMKNNLGLA